MTRLLPVLLVAAALVGCNPIVYVPAPIPAAPQGPGLRAGLGANLLGSQGIAHASVAPAEGIALYADGLAASSLDDGEGDGGFTHLGGDLGMLVTRPLSFSSAVELGVSIGRDAIEASEYGYDIGCCSGSYEPVTFHADRFAGHVGVFFSDGPRAAERFRIGPAVRLTYLDVRDEGGSQARGLFVEPALRSGFSEGPVEFQFQVGLSVLASGDVFDQFNTIPLFTGAQAAIRLDRLGR